MAAALVDQLRDFGLSQPFLFRQAVIGARFLDRIEIFALQVLDQRQRHNLTFAQIANNRRNFMELCTLGRAPAALPGHQAIAPGALRRDDHRLNHPARGNRRRQFIQRGLVEVAARLAGQRRNG